MACRYIKKNRHVMVCALAFAILAVTETRVVTRSVWHPVTFQIQVSGTANSTDFPVVDNGTGDPCVIPLPTNKFVLLAPYIVLAATILVATVATPVHVRHVKRREKLHIYGSSGFSETTTATGSTTVNKSYPYDPGDHRMQTQTKIVSMSVTGNSTYIGSFAAIESTSKASTGAIRQQVAGQDFPADCFFDVHIEIKTVLPCLRTAIHNDEPRSLSAVMTSIPPCASTYESPVAITLEYEQDNVAGAMLATTHHAEAPVCDIVIPVDKYSLMDPYIGLPQQL